MERQLEKQPSRSLRQFSTKQQRLYRECCRIRARLITANSGIFSCNYFLNSAISLYLKLQKSEEADDLLHYFECNNFTFNMYIPYGSDQGSR